MYITNMFHTDMILHNLKRSGFPSFKHSITFKVFVQTRLIFERHMEIIFC